MDLPDSAQQLIEPISRANEGPQHREGRPGRPLDRDYGAARITDGGAPELLNRLAQTYTGEGSDFPPMPDPPPGYVTRIAVDGVAGVGPWAE